MLNSKTPRTWIWLTLIFAVGARLTCADDRASTDRPAAQSNDRFLTLTATILMPDGSPAAGAIVESHKGSAQPSVTVRADDAGRAVLRDTFFNGAQIHAHSLDGTLQTVLMLVAANVRSTIANPVELKLARAVPHEVTVTSQGRSVKGAHVAAEGMGFRVSGVTGADGRCRLHFPAGQQLQAVVAWHPQLGVDGVRDSYHGFDEATTELSLLEPSPYTIRVMDAQGHPVSGLDLAVSVGTEARSWIMSREIEAARTRTNDNGEAVLAWLPRERVTSVDADLIDAAWKIDHIDRDRIEERITTIEVRPTRSVEGRIAFPGDVPVEGLLITGYGFGPQNRGDIPYSRTRSDGTFSLPIASLHGYVLGVSDRDWASELWTGVVLGSESDTPQTMQFEAYPATPLTVTVTRGSARQPVPDAWVHLSRNARVPLARGPGEPTIGMSGVRGWMLTDSTGIASTGVGRGEIELRLTSGDWTEERTIDVTSDQPVEVEFHRPWLGERRIIARMTRDGEAYQPSPGLVVRAWSKRPSQIADVFEPTVRDDGIIEVIFDYETLALLVVDREKQLSGFVRLGPEDETAELVMQPTASYSGTLLDENGDPLADRTLQLRTDSSFLDVVEPHRTDAAGRFQFTAVAVNAPLRLDVKNEDGLAEYFLGVDRMFEPGEVRDGDEVQPRRTDAAAIDDRPALPLADRLANSCENARVCGMHALVVLQGDGSENVNSLTGRVMNHDEVNSVLGYLPLSVSAEQFQSEAAALSDRAWPQPADGEIVLVVLNGHQETVAAETFSAADVNAALSAAGRFLEQHKPTFPDARVQLDEARLQAAGSNRRVWVISGGPRCGPCFKLARWIDEHPALLEKDYVIVKVMGGLQEHASEIGNEIGGGGHGIPWHVVTDAEGAILVTSEGPLGNIGMPGSVEGLRHFRRMLESTSQRLSADEIDALLESLSPNNER